MRSRSRRLFALLAVASTAACSAAGDGGGRPRPGRAQAACATPHDPAVELAPSPGPLRITEVVSANDGVAVDELGETDDFFEIQNQGEAPVSLANFLVTDSGGKPQRLPDRALAPGEALIVWADDAPEQGASHVDFKLDADGETLTLWAEPCTPVERVEVPALAQNEAFARFGAEFERCRYATPGRPNGARCVPPGPPSLPEEAPFAPYVFPSAWPPAPTPLAIAELRTSQDGFVELLNTADVAVSLAGYALRVASLTADSPYPARTEGVALVLPEAALEPGARVAVPLGEGAAGVIANSPRGEGVATLYAADGRVVDRIDFMSVPPAAALARVPDDNGPLLLCTRPTPGAPNDCIAQPSRAPGDRLRALSLPGDFAALAEGATETGMAPVKFIVDMQAGDAVHFLSAARWALHYTFVRELIYREPPLDRCDAREAQIFHDGWVAFSQREYERVEGRRFLMGTLVRHLNGLQTVEFTPGDLIDAAQMRRAFLAVVRRTHDPRAWALRPTDSEQLPELRKLERTLPIVGTNAPFNDLTYQPLTRAVGIGVLRFVPSGELAHEALPAETIVVTDDVPNDVPFVGGLITEAFQTPLAHVNVLSQGRGTPNMALHSARTHPRLAPLFGKLVRLEVGPQDFSVREASADEAAAFQEARRPRGPRLVAPSDLSLRGLVPLQGRGLEDLPALGAKAAQFAELYRARGLFDRCPSVVVPADAFAIPVAHYAEHFAASGAAALLRARSAEPAFRADPRVRAAALSAVRDAILRHPVAPDLLGAISALVRTRFGERRVRLRSSSNVEDLPTFNGAGLHTSASAELDDDERTLADALRVVWASLWELRAYDERESANLAHESALMGVLVHEAAGGEAAQGVAISRSLLDVTRGDVYYVNAQIGEAAVTNPAPGVTTDQLLYTARLGRPEVSYQTRSSLTHGAPVLDEQRLWSVACALEQVQLHFRPLLDPTERDRLFAMQIEFKVERSGALVVKQARPQPFGHVQLPADCR